MASDSALLHVAPGPRGAWTVVDDASSEALSEHAAAAAARRAAAARAERAGGGEVLVHDCYHHVHAHRCGPARSSS
jgi:hypothetical protein